MHSPTHLTASSAPKKSTSNADSLTAESFPLTPLAPSRYLTFAALAVSGCAIDLWTKHAIFQWRGVPGAREIWWLWEGYIGIETVYNPGALFGMGAGKGSLFAFLSIIAALSILYWLFVKRAAHSWWLTVALGCVMGGIFGNLYDRLGLWCDATIAIKDRSSVRDWILCRYGEHTWPNFNIADSLLVCGAILLLVQAFFFPDSRDVPASESA